MTRKKRIEIKTKRGTRYIYVNPKSTEALERRPVLGASNWPQVSDAFSVIPEQVKEYSEATRAAGIPTEYVPMEGGMYGPKFEDRNHRKKFYQWRECFDRNGMYGDA